jgi:hypothetical protein
MLLEVRGMESAPETFVQLWGKYVTGFRQEKHCIYCLRGPSEKQIHREMPSGDYKLRDDAPYFYLFAMGRGYRRETNVHLVVVPSPGAVASVGSMYGVTFTIRDARALRVDRLPEGWMGLPKLHATCRNFQFGVQEFGYKVPDTVAPGDFSHVPSAPLAE